MTVDVVIPVITMPFVMFLAAQGWYWTIGWFIALALSLSMFYCRSFRRKKRTRFFLSWTLTSFLFLLAVFELEVVPYLEILFIENFILMCFAMIMTTCSYFTKLQMAVVLPSYMKNEGLKNCEEAFILCDICGMTQPPRSNHCKICGTCVLRRDHHCIWLDTCVGAKNHRFYIGALISLIISCSYGANLTLTTVCHPILFWDMFLLPNDCSDVYGDLHISICYVSALYMLIVAIGAILKLMHQLWLICRNLTYQEWKHGTKYDHHKGCISNCMEFCYGYH